MLDLAAWLEVGDWTAPQDELVRDLGELPIEISAAELLNRRWRKVRKKGKTLAKLDAHRRHKLRIQSKKLRYAVEFFAGVFAGKRAAKRRKGLLAAPRAPARRGRRPQRYRRARETYRRDRHAAPAPEPQANIRCRAADQARGRAHAGASPVTRSALPPCQNSSIAERSPLRLIDHSAQIELILIKAKHKVPNGR
jgi:inorganic triphosphatase YgiF